MKMQPFQPLFLIAALVSFSSAAEAPKLVLHFFGSPACGECLKIKEEILFPFSKKYPDKIDLMVHNIDDTAGFNLMVKLESQFNVKTTASQELYFPDTFLIGFESITASAQKMIEERLAHPETWSRATQAGDSSGAQESIRKKLRQFTFIGILAAGLADGINPCAIATMIFLISFLATKKRKRGEILAIGMSFTAAVFLTYLLLGIGAFKALTFLSTYAWINKTIKWIAVAAAGIVALYCFRDAIVYGKTGKAQDIKLQLPKALKLRIHKVISGNLSSGSLMIGAIVTGFLVTLLEAVCTGQVYLPTIILMTRESGLKLTGWLYLLFYNFLFVLPLLIIMVLAFFGLRWDQLSKATQKHMVALKVLLGLVMTALAVFLAMAV